MAFKIEIISQLKFQVKGFGWVHCVFSVYFVSQVKKVEK